MRVMKRRSDLDHSIFILRDGERNQEVNQSKCKAETRPADKQVEDAQFPAVLQKAVCTAPAQKNSKQDIDPLIYLVAGAVLLPVDIFLQSTHDETVVLLSKLKVDHHIEIELKMDELDLTAAESKATYDEIKAYVLNKYGLKVSQLYIAQIKRKCGIIERKNYNVSKKEDAKVPQCPPEKEAAIMDALKHFQMI